VLSDVDVEESSEEACQQAQLISVYDDEIPEVIEIFDIDDLNDSEQQERDAEGSDDNRVWFGSDAQEQETTSIFHGEAFILVGTSFQIR
jgi:hypothetical protein